MNKPDALNPLVSVIVTTRNEERNIGNCLKSIQLQTYKPIEMIVVDNNSNDRTQEIARSYTDVVVNKGPERSAQRNFGICEMASGVYAMFIDADMILTPGLIESCVNEIHKTEVPALHILELILGRGLLANIRRFEREFYSGTVIDGARFFSRSLFCQLGGFDEALLPGPEDWDLDMRIKEIGPIRLLTCRSNSIVWSMAPFIDERGVRHDPGFNGIYHNEDEQSLRRYLGKKRYYAPSMELYQSKWIASKSVIRKQLGIKYRLWTVFIENGKYRKSFSRPVLFTLTILLKIAVAARYTAVVFRKKLTSMSMKD
jgi:glycosyltransferase involved in cell wall biosynthesis